MEIKNEYTINVHVRDSKGRVIKDKHGIKRPRLSYSLTISKEALPLILRQDGLTFEAWVKEGLKISLEALIHNSISSTFMSMGEYFVNTDEYKDYSK